MPAVNGADFDLFGF